jgi:hypothetical protein
MLKDYQPDGRQEMLDDQEDDGKMISEMERVIKKPTLKQIPMQ